jgi:hypothetical protein
MWQRAWVGSSRLAAVTLVLWGALEAMRVLARLLEALAPPRDEGADGGGPEEELPPIVIRPESKRQEWRN